MEERIGSYTVTTTLGRGGYGEVFGATHSVIGRDVAIKVLHAKWSDDAEAVRRFVAEAQAVNAVRHPNIVDIVDFGTLEDGRHYHVMERLRGESLRARLDAKGVLSIAEAVEILRPIAAALDAAHNAGIVHRDVKPENVFLHQDGDHEIVKLIDFGLAKLASTELAPTQSGVIMGTPAYMAPEQCRGQAVDARTDAYAFGVLAYELLTGSVPLKGADPIATLLAHVHETPVPPSRTAAMPIGVDRVVMSLLAKAPASRPQRLTPVVEELATLQRGPMRRRLRWPWLAAASLIVVGGGFAAMTVTRSDAPPRIDAAPTSPQPAAASATAEVPAEPAMSGTGSASTAVVPIDAGTRPKAVRPNPEAPENPYP
jgi:eukaryotic-like serine/threonine-protein kinase